MKDVYFSWFMALAVGVVAALYAVRLLRAGRARYRRADAYGGTVFLGVSAMEIGYWVLHPVAAALDRMGVTANRITLFAILPGVAAGVAVGSGWLGLGCVLATVAACCDTLDGLLARRHGGGSLAGQALDSIVDRVTESALLVGSIIYFRFSTGLTLLAALALTGANLVSYVSAKAEALHVKAPRGVMRRAERAVILLLGFWLTPIAAAMTAANPSSLSLPLRHLPLAIALFLIATVANVSAMRRTGALVRILRQREPGGSDRDHAGPAHEAATPPGVGAPAGAIAPRGIGKRNPDIGIVAPAATSQ